MKLSWTQRLGLLAKAVKGQWDLTPGSVGFQLLQGVFPTQGGMPPVRGTHAMVQGYGTMPWVRAVAGRVGYSVAATCWRLYANKGPDKRGQPARRALLRKDIQFAPLKVRKALLGQIKDKEELTEITDHPLLDVLNFGNPLHSGFDIRKMAQVHRDLVGEAFWLVERGPVAATGQRKPPPLAIWPIPSTWIQGTPTPGHPFFRVSFRTWQGEIPATEFLWFKDPDPSMPYWRGQGMAQSLADELEIDEYTAKYMKQFFYNGARPDVIISPKGEYAQISQAEMDRLDAEWAQKHQGFWRQFKPHFANQPVEVTDFPHNFQHLQMNELRKSTRDICLQVWGVPPEILGIIESSNRATIDAADYLYSRWVVEPRLESWRLDFQRMLIPQYDERLILDYESPVQADIAFRAEIMKGMPWAFEADEIREVAGLAPLEDELGGFHMEPINLTRVEDWEMPEEEPPLEPDLPAPPTPTANGTGRPPRDQADPVGAALGRLSDAELVKLAEEVAKRNGSPR